MCKNLLKKSLKVKYTFFAFLLSRRLYLKPGRCPASSRLIGNPSVPPVCAHPGSSRAPALGKRRERDAGHCAVTPLAVGSREGTCTQEGFCHFTQQAAGPCLCLLGHQGVPALRTATGPAALLQPSRGCSSAWGGAGHAPADPTPAVAALPCHLQHLLLGA